MSEKKNNEPQEERLTKIFVADGEPELALPPLPGREIMRHRTKAMRTRPQDNMVIHPEGTLLSYSMTLSELTREVHHLNHRITMAVQEFSQETTKFRALIDLPKQVQDFHKHLEERLEELVAQVEQALQEVWESLDSLLAGKARPNDETLALVMQVLKQLQERVDKLEAKGRPQLGKSSQNRS